MNAIVIEKLKEKYPELYRKFSDKEATSKILSWQIAKGLEYLHSNNIIQKDLKPDNILFCTGDLNAKITDFTISQQLEGPESLCYNPPGTTPFQAPESMFSGNGFSGQKSDIWAMGICMYAMMSDGSLPFWSSESEMQTQLSIQGQAYPVLDEFSDEFKDLLSKILNKNPEERISLSNLFSHAWMTIGLI